MPLPIIVAQAGTLSLPVEYAAPIGIIGGIVTILGVGWKAIEKVRSIARQEWQTKPFERRVTEIQTANMQTEAFRAVMKDIVAEAFTGREEADRYFRRETLEKQEKVVATAIAGISDKLDARFREMEGKIEARAQQTNDRTTELLVKVETAVRDAKGYTASVARQYDEIKKTLQQRPGNA
jgi:hypothetical protein